MFRRLLVPTDGSDQLNAALPLIRHLASRTGAGVQFVCVESPVVNMGNVLDNSTALVEHSEKVRQMERWMEELQRDGIEANYSVEFSRPEHGIEAAARHHSCDLIVMTPHLREGFAAVLHPSITARMFSSAPAPLLIVPEAASNSARGGLLAEADAVVVVPLDGSELAERAIPFAVALAGEYGRGLQLVRVLPPPRDMSVYAAYIRPDEGHQRQVNDARRYMTEMQARVKRATGLAVDVEVTIGEPAREIADLAGEDPTNLIVMSTHGHGTLGRMLLGSVAADVMWQSHVPVLIVPPHAAAPTHDAVLAVSSATPES